MLQGDRPPKKDSTSYGATPTQSSAQQELNLPLTQANGKGVVVTPPIALQALAHSISSWQLTQVNK